MGGEEVTSAQVGRLDSNRIAHSRTRGRAAAGGYAACMAKKSKPKFKPRPWTARDDEKLAAVVRENRDSGIVKLYTPHNYPVPLRKVDYAGRLKRYAEENFRTYEAVRKRASRLGLRSYPTAWSWQELNFYADPIRVPDNDVASALPSKGETPRPFPTWRNKNDWRKRRPKRW